MYSRRILSSNVSYQELKQYSCFKQLAKFIDVLVLKQILPMVVKKVSLDITNEAAFRKNMMYIPEENYDFFSQSSIVDSVITANAIEFILNSCKQSTKMKFFMIEAKIYNILRHLYHKKICCIDHLKSFEKLNFFYRAGLDQIPFGGYVYRKQDKIDSIYYLVKGEIKISKSIDEKEIAICSVYEGNFFGLYEFSKNKTRRILNAQSSSNNNIVLSISLDMLTELFGKDENQVLSKLLTLPSEIEKTNREEYRKMNLKQVKQKKNHFIKAYEFQRRLNKFSDDRSINRAESAFGRFVDNKSLLFKIKDSNDFIPRLKQESIKITTNFHKNQATIKYYERLNQHRLNNLDSTITRNFMQKENQSNQILTFTKPSQILASRLRERFDTSRMMFVLSAVGQIPTLSNAEAIEIEMIK